MAKYSDIKGFTVQTLSTDTVASAIAGGTWSSGGNLNEGRTRGAGSGTQTASILAGGTPPTTADVESYNGSSWTEITELNTGRTGSHASSAAPYSATIVFAGDTGTYPTSNNVANNEYWNGSSWTELADVNTARNSGGGAGTAYTAALLFCGYSTGIVSNTESWNGSAWTEVNNANTARYFVGGAGSLTSAILGGGETPSVTNKTETWDGTNWTEVANMPVSTNYVAFTGSANSDILGMFGPSTGTGTFHWDGTSFSELAEYSVGRGAGGAVATGNSTSGLLSGGNPAPVSASTEEWDTGPSDFVQIHEGQLFFNSTANAFKETISDVPSGVWSSGGNLNTGRSSSFGYGDSNSAAGVVSGISGPPDTNSTAHEQYNGSSWTEVNEMNNPRSDGSASGPFTSSIMIAGFDTYGQYSAPYAVDCETWNGTSFTEVVNLNSGRGYVGSSGTSSTSALVSSGYTSPPATGYANTEIFDGSSWTEVGDLNEARPGASGATSAPVSDTIMTGGNDGPPAPRTGITESWNGTSWTEVADMNAGKNGATVAGDSGSNALAYGGSRGSPNPSATQTELWNGTAWTELSDYSTNRGGSQKAGVTSVTAAILAGGEPRSTATEEWNAPLANKTITST